MQGGWLCELWPGREVGVRGHARQLLGFTALPCGPLPLRPHADGQERPPSAGLRPAAARSCVGTPGLEPRCGRVGVPLHPGSPRPAGRPRGAGMHAPGLGSWVPSLWGPHPCCAPHFSSSHCNSQTEPPQSTLVSSSSLQLPRVTAPRMPLRASGGTPTPRSPMLSSCPDFPSSLPHLSPKVTSFLVDGIPRVPSLSPGGSPRPPSRQLHRCAVLHPCSQIRSASGGRPVFPPALSCLRLGGRQERIGKLHLRYSEWLELLQDTVLRAAVVRLQELAPRLPHAWAVSSTPLSARLPHLVTAVHPHPAPLCPGERASPTWASRQVCRIPKHRVWCCGPLPVCTPVSSCDRAQETSQGHTVY